MAAESSTLRFHRSIGIADNTNNPSMLQQKFAASTLLNLILLKKNCDAGERENRAQRIFDRLWLRRLG